MPIKRQFRGGGDRGGKENSLSPSSSREHHHFGKILAVLIAVVISEHQRKWTRKMEKQLKEKLKHLEDRHKAERNAVVRLQHQLRHKVLDATSSFGGNGNDDDDDYGDEKTRSKTSQNSPQQFGPAIARAQSCFSRRAGTPRQGGSLVASARCRLHFDVEFVPKRSLEGLEEYSHAWVIYVFHANTNACGTKNGGAVKALVSVPRLNGEKRGCLSTRTPHRPRPVGLSLGRIISVDWERGEVTLGGIDLVDGTPVLDIKPYVPWCDSVPEATAPKWVTRAIEGEEGGEPLAIGEVKLASPEEETREKVKRAYEERFEIDSKKGGKKRRPLYENPDDFLAFVMDTLRLDVRSTRERTAKVEERKFDTYRVTLCDVEVAYVIGKEGDGVVTIVDAVAVEPSVIPGSADLDRPAITRNDNDKYFKK